jgi:hypothetical protein
MAGAAEHAKSARGVYRFRTSRARLTCGLGRSFLILEVASVERRARMGFEPPKL